MSDSGPITRQRPGSRHVRRPTSPASGPRPPVPAPKAPPNVPVNLDLVAHVLAQVDARLPEKVVDAANKVASRVELGLKKELEAIVQAKAAPLTKRLAVLEQRGAAPAAGSDVDLVVEARVYELAGSIEDAAVTRVGAALEARLDELVGERLKKAEGRIASQTAATLDLKSLEERVVARVAEHASCDEIAAKVAPAIEGRLDKIIEKTVARCVEERLAGIEKVVAERVARVAEEKLAALVAARVERLEGERLVRLVGECVERLAARVPDAKALEAAIDRQLGEVRAKLQSGLDHLAQVAVEKHMQFVDARAKAVAGDAVSCLDDFEKVVLERLEDLVATKVAEARPSGIPTVDELALMVASSNELKLAFDKRFRAMAQHIESDVVPRALKKCTPES